MKFLADYGHPYVVDDVAAPIIPKYSWNYDVVNNDFMLKPTSMIEETTGPAVWVTINTHKFLVPSSWHIMVVDDETRLVDTVQIVQCASGGFSALLVHPSVQDYSASKVVLHDLVVSEPCVHLMFPRQMMTLHPVGAVHLTSGVRNPLKVGLEYCCLLAPQDLGKFLDNRTVMEIVL